MPGVIRIQFEVCLLLVTFTFHLSTFYFLVDLCHMFKYLMKLKWLDSIRSFHFIYRPVSYIQIVAYDRLQKVYTYTDVVKCCL
jgi:hypothetical protein